MVRLFGSKRAFFSYWWFFFWITHEHSTASHLPFRYEAKCLKVSPTATSRQLSMTHVHWKLLSCFITSLLSPHHPSLAILLWRATNQLIQNRCPPGPVLNNSLPPCTTSSSINPHTDITLWVKTSDICPTSWERKPRRRPQRRVRTWWGTAKKKTKKETEEKLLEKIFSNLCHRSTLTTLYSMLPMVEAASPRTGGPTPD